METRFDALIVGTGHAGALTAVGLRQRKFEGSICILGNESDLPYERPPLSKEYLAGERAFERILLRPEDFWAERRIDLRLGDGVVKVDSNERCVTLRSGKMIGYDKLVWAAGGSPRTLSCDGSELAGIHTVRNRADVDRMSIELASIVDVVVIGGGYIGLEAAAVLAKLGKKVVLLEALDRVLARVAGEPISRFFEAEHRAHGVEVRTSVRVECLEAQESRVSGVRLADGSVVPAEMVIVGIGITPNVEPLALAGATTGNGVRVDEHCRTSLPEVFAIGDCALHSSRYAGGAWIRLESVQNATDQAQTVARWITGDPHPYESVPWFWSDQYDLKLQTVGLSAGFDDLLVRGDPATRSFSVVYFRDGRIIALDCVNDVKDYAQGRALVQAGAAVSKDKLADRRSSLKELAA